MSEPAHDEEIKSEDLEWQRAVVQEGRPHGTVISVRLDAGEAERLRRLAETLRLNMSQVLRQALADFDPRVGRAGVTWRPFTFGGVNWPTKVEIDPNEPRAESRTELAPRISETLAG